MNDITKRHFFYYYNNKKLLLSCHICNIVKLGIDFLIFDYFFVLPYAISIDLSIFFRMYLNIILGAVNVSLLTKEAK